MKKKKKKWKPKIDEISSILALLANHLSRTPERHEQLPLARQSKAAALFIVHWDRQYSSPSWHAPPQQTGEPYNGPYDVALYGGGPEGKCLASHEFLVDVTLAT